MIMRIDKKYNAPRGKERERGSLVVYSSCDRQTEERNRHHIRLFSCVWEKPNVQKWEERMMMWTHDSDSSLEPEEEEGWDHHEDYSWCTVPVDQATDQKRRITSSGVKRTAHIRATGGKVNRRTGIILIIMGQVLHLSLYLPQKIEKEGQHMNICSFCYNTSHVQPAKSLFRLTKVLLCKSISS